MCQAVQLALQLSLSASRLSWQLSVKLLPAFGHLALNALML